MNASLCEANRHTSTVAEPRIGLVLSGGGARAAAHLGVLAVLEREFSFDCVVGTSAGSADRAVLCPWLHYARRCLRW